MDIGTGTQTSSREVVVMRSDPGRDTTQKGKIRDPSTSDKSTTSLPRVETSPHHEIVDEGKVTGSYNVTV